MYLNEPVDFLKYKVPHYDPAKLERAIIWLHAAWSGQSKIFRDKILQLAKENFRPELLLIELDHDYIDYEWYKKVFNTRFFPQGQGDALWIANGKVIAADANCYLLSESFLQQRLQQIIENIN